jgi:hypothetical protein
MVEYKSVSCPSCGNRIENVDRFSAMAVCDYCGCGCYFQDEAVMAMGEMAILTEYPTPMYLHATGTLRDRRFTVVGRVRYRYSGGFWDEWYLSFSDGSYGWVAEDEAEFSLEKEIENPGDIPGYDKVRPGDNLIIAGESVIVDERNVAKLEGAEGSLPWVLSKDTEFPYIDASQEDYTVTIEYSEDGPEVFLGEWIDLSEIKLDRPKEDEEYSGWSDA